MTHEEQIISALLGLRYHGMTPREVLGAIGLVAEDFQDAFLRSAFGACCVLADRGRQTDPESVSAVLRANSGDLARLEILSGQNTLFFVEQIQTVAEELRRVSRLRKLEAFHREQLNQLKRPNADPVALGAAVSQFAATYTATTEGDGTGDQDVLELAEEWESFVTGKREPYLATGIEALDAEIGGFVCNLNVIGGLPSVGKSALTAEIIANCLGRGLRVGLFGLEDATKWVAKRLASRSAGIAVGRFGASRLNQFEQEKLQFALGKTSNLLSNLVTYKRAGIDVATLMQRCKYWVINRGVKAIFIDHGGEIQHSRNSQDDFRLAVTDTYRQLRDFAVNFKVPVIVLSHFNRDTEKTQGGIPKMSNFAEAAGIERMARVALGLWENGSELRCTILKRTEGKRGVTLWLQRDTDYALVNSKGGGVLDLDAEKKERLQTRSKLWSEADTQ